MKIYSMTATFGKLQHETLTLQPGLNLIEAPNEWGKSTWCAFILAMLYGIDTSSRSKKDFIADKERFAPWSGAPMSGRMDISWNGRDITIERTTKGRSVFGQFKAYETESGLEVAELTAANCGQMLLGVEQSVFARAGFVRLKDMPVSQDDSLRRRLNALVTTGDDSGSSDDLAQKLRDLKNHCRFNKSGLLPQAETQRAELEGKLSELESLHRQVEALENRQQELKNYQEQLQNHKQALEFEADRNYAGKLAMARAQLEITGERVETLDAACSKLPNPKMLELKKLQMQQLGEKKEALQMEIQLQPPAPQMPEIPSRFQGITPEQAEKDVQEFEQLLASRKKPNALGWIIGLVLSGAGVVLLLLKAGILCLLAGLLVTAAGFAAYGIRKSRNKTLKAQAQAIGQKYAPLEKTQWVSQVQQYADAQEDYESNLNDYRQRLQQLQVRYKAILDQIEAMTGGMSAMHYEQELENALQQHRSFAESLRERSRLEDMVQTLESSHREVEAPKLPDEMTFDSAQTDRLLSDAALEMRQLHQRLGQCQGRMEALGDAAAIRAQLEKVQQRIAGLEKVYSAVMLAQQTLDTAKQELQRRFAPRISQRAQELFAAMTGGRYQRIVLGEDLSLSAAAEGEDTLRNALWRSDGTADQLYLALRLAVAEELTPQAPLVLDDAFVRFDDDRLKEILKILKQSGQDKQILVFTCQSRESKIMEELS